MYNIKRAFSILFNQIKKTGVTIQIKQAPPHKIKDNDQSIKLGAINEESNSSLRSGTTTEQKRRRSSKTNRTN